MTKISGITIGKEATLEVFGVMVDMIKAKGAENKMVSIFDLLKELRNRNSEYAVKVIVEIVIDKMINLKYVRYYKNDKGYTYYGITSLGWEKWKESNNG